MKLAHQTSARYSPLSDSSLCYNQVNNQNQKLEKIDNSMQKTTEKQTVVNARQRYLLK